MFVLEGWIADTPKHTHAHTRAHACKPIQEMFSRFCHVFFPCRLIVFQPLRDAIILHSLCCNTNTGDVLLVLPSGTTIADFSVVHLAATTYVQAAPSIGGLTAVRNVAKRVRNIDTDSWAFVTISGETFRRLGKLAIELAFCDGSGRERRLCGQYVEGIACGIV